MIRMLLVLSIITAAVYLLLFRQGTDAPAELRHQQQLDQARGVEQQIRQDADNRARQIDDMTQ